MRTKALPPVPTSINVSQLSGPLREDGLGGLEPFDLDGVAGNDTGKLVGVGLTHAQHYSKRISILNGVELGAFDAFSFWDTIPDKFALDPTGEDEEGDGLIDGSCTDGDCDGVFSNGNCLVTISGPTVKKNKIDPRYVIIEPNGLDLNATCDTTVFLVTKLVSGSGKGKNAAVVFEPSECRVGTTSGAASLFDTVTLNRGVRAFDTATNELLLGPVGSIELEPIGC